MTASKGRRFRKMYQIMARGALATDGGKCGFFRPTSATPATHIELNTEQDRTITHVPASFQWKPA
jgi:hypothetical protein